MPRTAPASPKAGARVSGTCSTNALPVAVSKLLLRSTSRSRTSIGAAWVGLCPNWAPRSSWAGSGRLQ